MKERGQWCDRLLCAPDRSPKDKVYWTISTCNVEQDLYCGKSIRGDDVLRTPPVILSLPGVLVVGHTAVRVQGHIVCQVLAITHLKGGTIDNKR